MTDPSPPSWQLLAALAEDSQGVGHSLASVLNNAIAERYLRDPSRFPSFAGTSRLYLSADYSGDQADSNFRTVGLLLVAGEDVPGWKARLQALRSELNLKTRTMSYKGLKDGIKRKALVPFLQTLNGVRGYCLAVALEKRLAPTVEDVIGHSGLLAPLSEWRSSIRRKALDIALILAVLVVSTCPAESDLMLVTDDDPTTANPKRLGEFATLVRVAVGQLATVRYGKLEYRTTTIPGPNLFMEDICAIPDLAAGALMGLLRSLGSAAATDPIVVDSSKLDQRSHVLLPWLLGGAGSLTRIAAVVDQASPPNLARVRLLGIHA